MADASKGHQVDLGDLVEVTTRAVERAVEARRTPFPFGTTIGIVFTPHFPDPEEPFGQPGGVSQDFLRTIAVRAGEFHGRFVKEAVDAKLTVAARVSRQLTNLENLHLLTATESQGIGKALDALRNKSVSLKEVATLVSRLHSEFMTQRGTSLVALALVGVVNDSVNRALGTVASSGALASAAEAEEKGKGVASSDADGAVEGGGLGAIAGAEVGAGAGGVGALPGALLGGLIGLLGGGAVKSIGAAIDDD